MKKIFGVLLLISNLAYADIGAPVYNLETNLDNILKAKADTVKLEEVQALAKNNNVDLDVALENYFIAKKQVSVARAAFNPVTTGHLLGISMGLSYTWIPLAVEAVLSIPTKIYNVEKNKYLARAQSQNVADFRNVLRNEVAHLYFETLTHKAILESIDLESQILNDQLTSWEQKQVSKERLAELQKWMLRLSLERTDIYKVHLEEVMALNILLNTQELSEYNLAAVTEAVSKEWYSGIDLSTKVDSSVSSNPKYLSAVNLEQAANKNVKSVKWSIIAPSGISLAYKSNVRIAKNDKEVARLRRISAWETLKSNVYLRRNNLDSSVNVLKNYTLVSDVSKDVFRDSLAMYELGQLSEDNVIETALTTIRDFRSKIVAHYSAYSTYDDFNYSLNYSLKSKKTTTEGETTEVQNPETTKPTETESSDGSKVLTAADFKVLVNVDGNSLKVKLVSDYLDDVYEVDYIFNSKRFSNKSSVDSKDDFKVNVKKLFMPDVVKGVALVTLKNKTELRVKF